MAWHRHFNSAVAANINFRKKHSIRHENPKLFQVHDEKCEHTEHFQSTVSRIHDKVSHLVDSTSSLSFQAPTNVTDFFKQHLILL